MKRNLKTVALIIIGLAVTGAAYTLITDATAGNNESAGAAAKDSTAQISKKPKAAKKEEGKTEKHSTKDSTATKDGKTDKSAAVDTITTASGLKYIITAQGEGDAVKSGQVVAVHYAGRLASNGKEFDNSFKRQSPIEFKLGIGKVIKGWDEGIAGMRVGELRTLIIPSDLAYGKRGAGGGLIPANATLIFDVQLVAIK